MFCTFCASFLSKQYSETSKVNNLQLTINIPWTARLMFLQRVANFPRSICGTKMPKQERRNIWMLSLEFFPCFSYPKAIPRSVYTYSRLNIWVDYQTPALKEAFHPCLACSCLLSFSTYILNLTSHWHFPLSRSPEKTISSVFSQTNRDRSVMTVPTLPRLPYLITRIPVFP